MREVEIKIKIADADRTAEALQKKGCVFSEPIVQHDTVYIPNDQPTVPVPPGVNVLRIRRQDGKILFTLKQSDAGNHLSKLEHELEINDAEEMGRIIKLLDYKVIADTVKTRRKCRTGKYEICVDRVKELGDFLEIEEMTDFDPVAAQKAMLEFISKFGIDVSQRLDFGYDVLYVQKYESLKSK